MSKIFTVMTIAGFVAATPAIAATVSFENADANSDGNVTMEEAKGVMPDLTAAQFEAMDTDKSGGLSKKEFSAHAG